MEQRPKIRVWFIVAMTLIGVLLTANFFVLGQKDWGEAAKALSRVASSLVVPLCLTGVILAARRHQWLAIVCLSATVCHVGYDCVINLIGKEMSMTAGDYWKWEVEWMISTLQFWSGMSMLIWLPRFSGWRRVIQFCAFGVVCTFMLGQESNLMYQVMSGKAWWIDSNNYESYLAILAAPLFVGAAMVAYAAGFYQVKVSEEAGEVREVKVICPNCHYMLVTHTGKSACPHCQLGFEIRVAEPRCGKCGYNMVHNQSEVCPECGVKVERLKVARELGRTTA